MVDGFSPMDGVSSQALEAPVPPKTGIAGLLSTTLGKIVVGGVALLLVVGVAAAVFLTFFSASPAPEVVVPPASVPSTPTASGEATQPPAPRPPASLNNLFTFRNPFQPTISPPSVSTASTDASGTTSTEGIPADTLMLMSIETVNGEQQAVLYWNGVTYTVSEGDRLGDTPWSVIQINDTSVVMQYGDSQITLSVGQGVTK